MSNVLERKIAELERRVSPPTPAPRYVMLLSTFKALTPMEKVDTYRMLVRGELTLETGRDRRPVHVASKAELEAMTPDERVLEYRRALAEALER